MAVNAGSSSLKFQLLEMPKEEVITEGLFEKIGLKDPHFTIKYHGLKYDDLLQKFLQGNVQSFFLLTPLITFQLHLDDFEL